MKPYIAEVIGTCIFALVLILATAANPWIATIFAVFTLMFIAYGFGHVSGAHVNPALTLGALAVNKISPLRALYYIIAQVAGVALAILIVKFSKIASPGVLESVFSWKLFGAEIIGTALFGYGVAAVAFAKVHKAASGFVVGLSLFAGIILSSLLLNGTELSASLNPAVAYGLGALNLASILGPILGSIIGMWTYVYLSENAKDIWKGFKRSISPASTPSPSPTHQNHEGHHHVDGNRIA